MRKVKHNKIRNTGLLYEFLLRQVTLDVLKDNDSKAVKIIKKRFNENTELGKELALYNIVLNKKFTSDKKAEYFINEAVDCFRKLNKSILKRERYNLIKEHVTTNNKSIKLSETVRVLPNDEDLRILTYKTLLEKFNQKYSKLNLSQKNLLRAYINNVSNTSSLKEYIQKQVPLIKQGLKKYSKNLTDEVVKIKMNEAIKSINKFCKLTESNLVKDSTVVQTMRYLELLKEVKKSGNKNKKVI
jgi:hypothetical protein